MSEINAMKSVEDALEALDGPARDRVLAWASAKYSHSLVPILPDKIAAQSGSSGKKAKEKTSSSGKSKSKKSVIAMDKSLNFNPTGKVGAEEFVALKKPTNAKEKCVVACYFLRENVEVDTVTVSGVHTFFKHVGWSLPADLRNMLAQAGSEGWLDTSDGENILITSTGENLVEHKLPKLKD